MVSGEQSQRSIARNNRSYSRRTSLRENQWHPTSRKSGSLHTVSYQRIPSPKLPSGKTQVVQQSVGYDRFQSPWDVLPLTVTGETSSADQDDVRPVTHGNSTISSRKDQKPDFITLSMLFYYRRNSRARFTVSRKSWTSPGYCNLSQIYGRSRGAIGNPHDKKSGSGLAQ